MFYLQFDACILVLRSCAGANAITHDYVVGFFKNAREDDEITNGPKIFDIIS